MKAIRFMMMAVMSVFIGTSFVSCLDDGDNRKQYGAMVTVDEFMGIVSLVTDEGLMLTPTNPSFIQYEEDGVKKYPTRAYVNFYIVDDVPVVEGQTKYDVELFFGYIFTPKLMNPGAVEGKNPFEAIGLFPSNGKYINFEISYYGTKESTSEDLKIYIDKAENGTLYINVVNTEEIEKNATTVLIGGLYSVPTPSKSQIQNSFPEFQFGSDDTVTLKIIAKGVDGKGVDKEINVTKFKLIN